jgi:hypothetical protein
VATLLLDAAGPEIAVRDLQLSIQQTFRCGSPPVHSLLRGVGYLYVVRACFEVQVDRHFQKAEGQSGAAHAMGFAEENSLG